MNRHTVSCMSAKGTTVAADDSENAVSEYFLNNPRMIGALFTILLLLSQAGNVAGNGGSTVGP